MVSVLVVIVGVEPMTMACLGNLEPAKLADLLGADAEFSHVTPSRKPYPLPLWLGSAKDSTLKGRHQVRGPEIAEIAVFTTEKT